MSVIITNIDQNPRPKGRHLYALAINETRICTFHHYREHGLGICLFLAGAAALRHAEKQLQQKLERVLKGE